jgi:peptidoglycan/LPS O-acetylase OafA/YrhL
MKSKLYFNGLNELRAFAALAVVFHHIELYKHRLGMDSLYKVSFVNGFIENLGKNGVYLFFVLSGFLITYLLLEEKSITGEISVSKFYKRRILRIWPLYYIIVVIGFFLLPFLYNCFSNFFEGQTSFNERIENLVYGKNLFLFLFFFSNVALQIFGGVAGAAQSWSVSVEEQFYFIWPWIVKFFSNILGVVLFLIIIIINLINYNIDVFNSVPILKAFFSTFNVDLMAIGGIVAIVYRNYREIVQQLVTNRIIILFVFISVISQLFYKTFLTTISLSFGMLILVFIENKIKIKWFSSLGKWSYGIYMYHPMVMYFSFSIVNKLKVKSFIGSNLMYYSLVFGLTIVISYFSYRYIELFFLKLKHKFSPVISGKL